MNLSKKFYTNSIRIFHYVIQAIPSYVIGYFKLP